MAASFEMICIFLDLYLLEVFCQENTVERITEQKGAKQSRLGCLSWGPDWTIHSHTGSGGDDDDKEEWRWKWCRVNWDTRAWLDHTWARCTPTSATTDDSSEIAGASWWRWWSGRWRRWWWRWWRRWWRGSPSGGGVNNDNRVQQQEQNNAAFPSCTLATYCSCASFQIAVSFHFHRCLQHLWQFRVQK